jgi:hypothetical protein
MFVCDCFAISDFLIGDWGSGAGSNHRTVVATINNPATANRQIGHKTPIVHRHHQSHIKNHPAIENH